MGLLWETTAVALLVMSAAAGWLAWYCTWFVAKQRLRKQLASAKARWDLRHEQESTGTLMESFTCGWLNLIVQALWTPVLEKHIAGLTSEALQRILNEVLTKNSARPPWRFIDSIAVEEFCFGLVPPQVQFCFARYDQVKSLLQLSLDVRFVSSGAQAVMLFGVKSLGLLQPFSMRMEATHVRLLGRLNLGLQFTQEPPGIKGLLYSFASAPELDISVRPLGLSIAGELPGLEGALKGVLARIIGRRLVEPKKGFFDIQRLYRNRHVARAGGPGGLVRVVVLCARDIARTSSPTPSHDSTSTKDPSKRPAAHTADTPSSAAAGSCGAYCQLRYGGKVLRTPVVYDSTSPVWNWQFDMPLKAELGKQADGFVHDTVRVEVLNALTVGDPSVCGACKLHLNELSLEPNGDARTLVLPLQGSQTKATIQLQVSWLQVTKRSNATATATDKAPTKLPDTVAVQLPSPLPPLPVQQPSLQQPLPLFQQQQQQQHQQQYASSEAGRTSATTLSRTSSMDSIIQQQQQQRPSATQIPPLPAVPDASQGMVDASAEGVLQQSMNTKPHMHRSTRESENGSRLAAKAVSWHDKATVSTPATPVPTDPSPEHPTSNSAGSTPSGHSRRHRWRHRRSHSVPQVLTHPADNHPAHSHTTNTHPAHSHPANTHPAHPQAATPAGSSSSSRWASFLLSPSRRSSAAGSMTGAPPASISATGSVLAHTSSSALLAAGAPAEEPTSHQLAGSHVQPDSSTEAQAATLPGVLPAAAGFDFDRMYSMSDHDGTSGGASHHTAAHTSDSMHEPGPDASAHDGSEYSIATTDAGAAAANDTMPNGHGMTVEPDSSGGMALTSNDAGASSGRPRVSFAGASAGDESSAHGSASALDGASRGGPWGSWVSPRAQQPVGSDVPAAGAAGAQQPAITGGSAWDGEVTPLAVLARVAKLQQALERERQATAQQAALLAQAEQRCDTLMRLRRADNRRALMEGARFLLHPSTPNQPPTAASAAAAGPAPAGAITPPRPVLLWFSDAEQALKVGALPERWETLKALRKLDGDGSIERHWLLNGSLPRDMVDVLQTVPTADVASVQAGSVLFAVGQGGEGGGSSGAWTRIKALLLSGPGDGADGGVVDGRCLSVLCGRQRAPVPLNLQLPPQGNGRSRDEWLAALAGLVSGQGEEGADGSQSGEDQTLDIGG